MKDGAAWTKGDYERESIEHTSYCLMGGLAAAHDLDFDQWTERAYCSDERAMLLGVINEQYHECNGGRGWGSVEDFNDDEETEFVDVDRVLDKAAVKWDESPIDTAPRDIDDEHPRCYCSTCVRNEYYNSL
jgi:hypothetical protein